MFSDEESKAVQEVAKATGKGIEAASALGRAIAKYMGGSLVQAFGIWEDKLKYLRWENQMRLLDRADKVLACRGLKGPTRGLPLKLGIPLLEQGSLEDDEEMQERWATLLANAVDADSGVDVSRAFIEILAQITSFEAKILDQIYSIPGQVIHSGLVTQNMPESVELHSGSPNAPSQEPSPDVQFALANLARLGCIRRESTWDRKESFRNVNQTVLGKRFVDACRNREVKDANDQDKSDCRSKPC